MFFFSRRKSPDPEKIRAVLHQFSKRNAEIHSVNRVKLEDGREVHRVAFAVTDPPGPWSLQFLEVEEKYAKLVEGLAPEMKVLYYESRDEARTRLLEVTGGELVPGLEV